MDHQQTAIFSNIKKPQTIKSILFIIVIFYFYTFVYTLVLSLTPHRAALLSTAFLKIIDILCAALFKYYYYT